MTNRAIDVLAAAIESDLTRDPKGPRVAESIAKYALTHQDWRDFALFDQASYTRNLVCKTERFEMLLLCWSPGQVTPIHNHEGQRCWMGVLDGRVEETLFHLPSPANPKLSSADSKRHDRGTVAFISDDIAWHRIAQVGAERAVSLHLYSRPIARCRVFDPATNALDWRTLGLHSTRGLLASLAQHAR